MRLSGQEQGLSAEFPADSPPMAACLAVMAGPPEDRMASLQEIERRHGPSTCTSYYVAGIGRGRSPPEKWLPLTANSMRRVIDVYPEHGIAWLYLAEALRDMGRLVEAEAELRRALVAVPDPGQRVRLYRLLASVREERGDSAGARAVERALGSALLRSGPPRYTFPHLFALIKAAIHEPRVFELMRKEVELATAAGVPEREWGARYRLSAALVDQGRPAESLEHYSRLAQLTESLDRDTLRMKTYHGRGRAFSKLGRLEEAELDLHRSIMLADRLQDSLFLADAYHDLAHVHEWAGRVTDAAAAIGRAVDIARVSLEGRSIRTIGLRDAGFIAWKDGRYAAAHRAFGEMTEVIERAEKNFAWAGEYKERIGDWRGAIHYYRRGLAADPRERALNLAGLARGYDALGRPDSAIAAAREHDRDISNPWGVPLLPELLARQDRTREAIGIARAWVDRRERGGHVEGAANAWLQLAELHLRARDPSSALEAAERARVHARRLDLPEARVRALRIRGQALVASGESRRGVAELRSAAALARAHPTPEGILSTHLALGEALRDRAPDEALRAFDRAAREVEATTGMLEADLDRVRYRDTRLAPFDGALALLLAEPAGPERLERLVGWSQRRGAAALRLATQGGAEGPGAGVLASPMASAALRRRLGAADAVLGYMVVGETVAVSVFSRDTGAVVSLPVTRTELRRLVERLQRPLQATYAGRLDLARARYDLRAARDLHRALVEPVEPLLGESRRLFVVADDVLHRVPFGALVTGSEPPAGSDGYADVPFLLDRYQIVYLPALGFLPPGGRVPRPRPTGTKVLAVAGDAPGAPEELEALRRTWRGGPVVSLEGAAATETAVDTLPDEEAVLHVAAHARVAADGSGLSYIELEPDARNDGAWTVGEITARPRRASLVVLSACETVEGPLYGGEGPLGLARAFLAAGAGAVLATHWPIGARAADLMGTFYEAITEGSEPAVALHTAKLRLRSDPATAHPFYWAGFVLMAGR